MSHGLTQLAEMINARFSRKQETAEMERRSGLSVDEVAAKQQRADAEAEARAEALRRELA